MVGSDLRLVEYVWVVDGGNCAMMVGDKCGFLRGDCIVIGGNCNLVRNDCGLLGIDCVGCGQR